MGGTDLEAWSVRTVMVGAYSGVMGQRTWSASSLAAGLMAMVLVLAACGESERKAPDFELALFGNGNHAEGELLSLSDLEGTPLVMNFWYPSCPPCRAEMPDLEASYQRYRDSGVLFLGVTSLQLDTTEDAREFIAEVGVTYPVGPDTDGTIMRAYGVNNFPSTVFVNAEQEVVRTWAGLLNEEKLGELIEEMIGERGSG